MRQSTRWSCLALILLALVACGQDTPLLPDAAPPNIATAVATEIGLPALDRSTSLPSAPAPDPPLATLPARETATPNPAVATNALPACTPKPERELALPENFAPNFPFPPGIKFSRAETLEDNPNYIRVVGYAPIGFKSAVNWLVEKLPKAGYELGRGDQEATEAEATFFGKGYSGGFRITVVPKCNGVTLWWVVALKKQ